jgi:plasmid stabilization system protein ParE
MRAVRWSENALADLEAQFDYIAHDNPAAARRVAARLRSAGEALGETATGRKGRVPGTYEKVVAGLPYIIAYAIGTLPDGGEVITIVRVIHGARNWPPGEWPE